MALTRRNWTAAAVCLVGLILAFHPMILSGLGEMQVNLGDTRLVNYIFEHSYLWLSRNPLHSEFTQWPVFFPHPHAGASTETLLGTAPLYWLFRFSGVESDTSLQLWMMSVSVLNFLFTFLFLRKGMGLGSLASSAGAFLFAFGGIRIAQAGHQQLLPQFPSILAIWGLLRAFRARRGGIPQFFLATVLQIYAGFYLGWFLVFGLTLSAIIAISISSLRRQVLGVFKKQWGRALLWAAISALLLFPMAKVYLGAAQQSGVWSWSDASSMVPRLQSWFYMGPESWLYSWTMGIKMFQVIPMEHEQRIGLGLVTLACAILGLYQARSQPPQRLLWLLFLSVPILSSTWIFREFTFWHLPFEYFPGGRAIRSVSRIALLLLIPASIGLALWIERTERRRGTWIATGLFLFCALEQAQTTEHYDKFEARQRLVALDRRIDEGSCDYFLYSPLLDPGARVKEEHFQIDAMWASLQSDVPTLNGYSGRFPPGWNLYWAGIRGPEDELRLSESIRSWIFAHGLDPHGFCWIKD